MAQAEQLEWTHVDSSNVEAVAYHEGTQKLCVRFKNGGLYSYDDVEEDIYVGLVHAASVGRYLNEQVKAMYPYTKYSGMLDLVDSLASK